MVTGALSGSAGGVKTRIVIMLRRTATRGRRNKMAEKSRHPIEATWKKSKPETD
jgi:hypothetical protein